MTQLQMFKLDENPDGRGLRCDLSGLFFAGQPLLERDERDLFRPRQSTSIRKIFNNAYSMDAQWESRIRSVDVVATALNKGDTVRAMIAAVLMRLPEPDSAARIKDAEGVLEKAGFDRDEPRDERGRWTSSGNAGDGNLIPVQLFGSTAVQPWIGPLIEEGPVKPVPMPSPTDIVPPAMVPRGLTREPASNPYPKKKKCAKEWAEAVKFCNGLVKKGKLKSAHGNRGFGGTYDQCVREQVSEECGGNVVEYEITAELNADSGNA